MTAIEQRTAGGAIVPPAVFLMAARLPHGEKWPVVAHFRNL